jgi:hypothetical protein
MRCQKSMSWDKTFAIESDRQAGVAFLSMDLDMTLSKFGHCCADAKGEGRTLQRTV